MELKSLALILITTLAIRDINSDDNNQNHQGTKTESLTNALRKKFGCTPTDEWNLVRQNSDNGIVNNVCISSSYQIYEQPSTLESEPVVLIFYDKKIHEIDERRNFLTISVKILALWEDSRIKVSNFSFNHFMVLPPITYTHKYIWTPLSDLIIARLKELTFTPDKKIAGIKLHQGRQINSYLSSLSKDKYRKNGLDEFSVRFNPDTIIVSAYGKWTIKVSCGFDFSKYPFDDQNCRLIMKVPFKNLTIFDAQHSLSNQEVFGNFDLKQRVYVLPGVWSDFTQAYQTLFGVQNNMTRKIDAYIYQFYVPCIFIVTMSFSSFIIPVTAIPGRIAVIVTQFLTLTNIFIHALVSNSKFTLNIS